MQSAPVPNPSRRLRPRTGSRLAAVQALYQVEQAGAAYETVIDEFVRHRLAAGSGALDDGSTAGAAVPLFASIVRGYAGRAETLDQAIAGLLAQGWSMPRLDPVLRGVLRAAAAELFDAQGAPARVVIDEYLDVAHGFFGGEEPRFVNGVLNQLARSLRPLEFTEPG
jgi:N utilization substance protein B